jgi:hypothetical protein
VATTVPLGQVEELAQQLSPAEQFKRVAHLWERLSAAPPGAVPRADETEWRRQREKEAEAKYLPNYP